MDDINWNDWLNREEITIDDALWLTMPAPIKPPGTNSPETSLFDDEYKERREIAESWREKGLLPGKIKLEENDRDWYIKPLAFFRLARDIEWLNPLNSEHDPIFIFLETMDKTERQISEKAHIQLLTEILKDSPKSLDSGWIAELWAAIPGESYENKPFWQIRDDYKKQIESAVIGGELEAVVEIREPGFDDGYKEITDKNRIRKIKDGWLNGADVRLTIYREQFQEWLKKSKQWPVVDGCLLINWFCSGPQAEAFEDGEVDYWDEPLNENSLADIDMEYWTESAAAPKSRDEWLKKLELDVTKIKEIEKARDRANQSGTELEKINVYANLAALTSRAEKYEDGVSSILWANLDMPSCMDERVRLFVWRHILKANEFKTPKAEFEINHNQQLLKKIAEIDSLLEIESIDNEGKTNKSSHNQNNGDSRESQFYALVWRVYQFLTSNSKTATAQKVWDEIRFRPEPHDIDKIIDKGRSDADVIHWTSKYENAQQHKRTTFDKTLSSIKRNPPSK